jgi:hypothetical protein
MREAWVAVSVCVGLSFCVSATASAVGLTRTFLSALTGNDANACSPTSPCRTFAHAIAVTAAGGEVIALDSGGYGAVSISQAVSIIAAPGAYAGITVFSGDGITINVAASDAVILRGLTLNGLGGNNGVNFNSGGTLILENCFVTNFPNNGILASTGGSLAVRDTNIKGCGNGIYLSLSAGTLLTSIDHCRLDFNGNGFQAQSTSGGITQTSATNSTANHNFTGWVCGNASSGIDELHLESCSASENGGDGLYSNSSNVLTFLLFSQCVIVNNSGFGVGQGGSGSVQSRANNSVRLNGSGSFGGTVGTFPAQ